ncbi:MAG: (2Fe-2S)-binding protein [Thermoanaerobaculia bacterium]|nr:(2Fe-2S)-binding protein [Thermoanaerobaculia bacterium]
MSDQCKKGGCDHSGVSRRGFLTTMGVGAVAAAAAGSALPATAEQQKASAAEPMTIGLSVNGRKHRLAVEPRETLLAVLRERLGFVGTKPGCERGECGACTVLVDGVTRYACLTLALEAEGHEITTIEGLARGEELGDVQKAFVEEDALQCGYCTPGQIMAAEGLLRANPSPTLDDVRLGMSGNLCRCGAYGHIFKAVERVARARREGGAK